MYRVCYTLGKWYAKEVDPDFENEDHIADIKELVDSGTAVILVDEYDELGLTPYSISELTVIKDDGDEIVHF